MATCLAHHNLLQFSILTMLGSLQTQRSFSFCNILNSPFTSFFLWPTWARWFRTPVIYVASSGEVVTFHNNTHYYYYYYHHHHHHHHHHYYYCYSLTHSLHGAGYYLKSWLSLSFSKNIPLSYGTRRFITVFTKARPWTLSWASRIQFAPSIPISLRSILMLSSHLCLGLPSGLSGLIHWLALQNFVPLLGYAVLSPCLLWWEADKWFDVYITLLGVGTTQWYNAELRAGWSGVRVLAGAGNFSLHHHVQTGSGAHPGYYPMGTRGSFLGCKAAGREADHSPPSSAEVKECVELYFHSPIRLHGMVLS
jgi:hypothetical protein